MQKCLALLICALVMCGQSRLIAQEKPELGDNVQAAIKLMQTDGNEAAAMEQFKAIEASADAPAYDKAAAAFFQGAMLESPEESEAAYLRSIKLVPEYAGNAWYNLAMLRMGQENLPGTLEAINALLELHPDDWKARSVLVQIYQKQGKPEARDEQIARILKQHEAGDIDAAYFIREKYKHEGHDGVAVAQHFKLEGDRAVRYKFYYLVPGGGMDVYSLGSYETTTAISRELGEIGPDERAWHLDHYPPGGGHETLAMYTAEPGYDVVRKMVTDAVDGTLKPISSTSVDGKPVTIEAGE